MNPLEGNDWMAILNDPKRVNQYIESRKKGNRMNPTFECVIRKAIRYPKDDKQGDGVIQQSEENIDFEKKKWISMQVLSIMRQTDCDIAEVLQFVADIDLFCFYEYCSNNINSFGFSEEESCEMKTRYYLTSLIIEINRIRSMRPSLQKSPSMSMNPVVNEATVSCKNYVDSWTAKGNDPHNKFYCYCCFILGCYSFFSLQWKQATEYWNCSNYAHFQWHTQDVSILNHLITSNEVTPLEEPKSLIHMESITQLQAATEKNYSHACLTSLDSPPGNLRLLYQIRDHLEKWNYQSFYFSKMDCIHHDQKGLACFMMSFFLLKCTSEVICLNQFLSFCNSNHIQNLLCERELKVNMIPFIYDISLLEFLISFYSKKTCVSEKYIFDALMTQMKNPAINMFNDSSILSTEISNIEKRFFRTLYIEYCLQS